MALARTLLVLLGLSASALAGLGCGRDDSTRQGTPSVVATTTQAADLARAVGHGRAHVEQILRPNSDPHDYEPRPSDVRSVARAGLVVRSGGDLDRWLAGIIDNSGSSAPVLELTHSVHVIRDEGGGPDPHWWQDPRNAERAVAAIRRALTRVDPAGRATYARNAAEYVTRLRRLDSSVASCVRRLPAAQRRLVTTHDALGYYARRYGLRLVGALIPSLSTAAQPSAGDTARLVRQVRREGVRAIFPESSINPRLERAVARETGAKVGRALWADSLGPAGSSGATYITSIQANTEAIVSGLSGGTERCRPAA